MSNPITWRNVNANFRGSNALAIAATRDFGNAANNLSQRFIDQGEYNQEQNTNKGLAALASFQDVDTFNKQKADLFAKNEGANIDFGALTTAANAQNKMLQDNSNFTLNQGIRQFQEDRDAIDFFKANDPATIAAGVQAEKDMLKYEAQLDNKYGYGSRNGSGKGGLSEFNAAMKVFTEPPAYRGVGEVGARKEVENINAEFSNYVGLSNREWAAILRKNTIPPSWKNFDPDADIEGIRFDATKAIKAKGLKDTTE